MAKAELRLQTTTLFSYPSQHYTERHERQHQTYRGATPDYILWNLLERYTRPKELVVDPMCGSGTTVVVARELGRRALGYDLEPAHPDVFRADARRLPLEDEKADFVFVDPPYSDHLRYSGKPGCIGELSAWGPEYFPSMAQVIGQIVRILRPERYTALYVHDTYEKGRGFVPIGYRLFALYEQAGLVPVDVLAVVRNNRTLLRNHFHTAAVEHNYFLRGFGHLFVFYKPSPKHPQPLDRRTPEERRAQLSAFAVARGEPEGAAPVNRDRRDAASRPRGVPGGRGGSGRDRRGS